MTHYHNPVMLQESIGGLNINPNGIYVDATFGGGGHSGAILSALDKGRLLVFDQDLDTQKNALNDKRVEMIPYNFRYISNLLRFLKVDKIDGLLADLGVSSYQFDTDIRGFSFRMEAPLDMRMNQQSKISAAHVLNNYSEKKLIEIFRTYGELKSAGKLSRAIVSERKSKPISTTFELRDLVLSVIKTSRTSKILAQVFQALRIEVNDEILALKDLLCQSSQIVRSKGRMVIISYHSLEDRLVKNYMRSGSFDKQVDKDFFGQVIKPFQALKEGVYKPSEMEVEANSRSRSAVLRIAEKI